MVTWDNISFHISGHFTTELADKRNPGQSRCESFFFFWKQTAGETQRSCFIKSLLDGENSEGSGFLVSSFSPRRSEARGDSVKDDGRRGVGGKRVTCCALSVNDVHGVALCTSARYRFFFYCLCLQESSVSVQIFQLNVLFFFMWKFFFFFRFMQCSCIPEISSLKSNSSILPKLLSKAFSASQHLLSCGRYFLHCSQSTTCFNFNTAWLDWCRTSHQ